MKQRYDLKTFLSAILDLRHWIFQNPRILAAN